MVGPNYIYCVKDGNYIVIINRKKSFDLQSKIQDAIDKVDLV